MRIEFPCDSWFLMIFLHVPCWNLTRAEVTSARKSPQSPVQPRLRRKVPKVEITKHRRQRSALCGGSKAGWRQREKNQKWTHYKTPHRCNQLLCCPGIKTCNKGRMRPAKVDPIKNQNCVYAVDWKPIGMLIREERRWGSRPSTFTTATRHY